MRGAAMHVTRVVEGHNDVVSCYPVNVMIRLRSCMVPYSSRLGKLTDPAVAFDED